MHCNMTHHASNQCKRLGHISVCPHQGRRTLRDNWLIHEAVTLPAIRVDLEKPNHVGGNITHARAQLMQMVA